MSLPSPRSGMRQSIRKSISDAVEAQLEVMAVADILHAMTDAGEIVERVYRCEHGEPIATRSPGGTWTFHDGCTRCRFAKWHKPSVCGVVSHSGAKGEPIACGFPPGHSGPHAWASLPTFALGHSGSFVERA